MATVTGLPKSVIDTVDKLSVMYGFDKDEASKRMFALRLKNIPEEIITRTSQMTLADKANAIHDMYTQKQTEKQQKKEAAAASKEQKEKEKAEKEEAAAAAAAEREEKKKQREQKKQEEQEAKEERKRLREEKRQQKEEAAAAAAAEREEKKKQREQKKQEEQEAKEERKRLREEKRAAKEEAAAEKEQKKKDDAAAKEQKQKDKQEKEAAKEAAAKLTPIPKHTPFCGVVYEGYCTGLRPAGGLFTQCTNPASKGGFCATCFKQSEKNPDNKPNNGVIQDRMAVGAFEFRNKKGQAPTPLLKILEKNGIDRIDFEKSHKEFVATAGITAEIPQENWVVKVAKRGRPKKSVTIQEPSQQSDDMIANVIVAETQKEEVVAEEQDDDEDETEVEKIEIGGKSYLKTEDGTLYHEDTMELAGTLNSEGGIDEVDDDEDDE